MTLAAAGYGGPGPSEEDDMSLLNLATRRRIAAVAYEVAKNNGARYDTNNKYNDLAPIGAPKCNIYVRDVLNQAGAMTPKFSANEWGNPRTNIPNWSPVTDGTVEPGDVVAFPRLGDSGHVGIVPAGAVGSTPDVLAATYGGVLPTQAFWNRPAGKTVVWRWNDY